MSGAQLSGAQLSGAQLSGAQMSGAQFRPTRIKVYLKVKVTTDDVCLTLLQEKI